MANENQSEGRTENAAVPVDEWKSGRGVQGVDDKQMDDAQSTGRTGAAEQSSFAPRETTDPNDMQGPAGDPAEGKRPGGSTYPA